MTDQPSDERLNAFVDGELTAADAAVLLGQLRTDAALRDRVSQLRLTKELVRHAYAGEPAAGRAAPAPGSRSRWQAAAVVVCAVAAGAWSGWAAREHSFGPAEALAVMADRATRPPLAAAERVVLHVSSAAAQDGRAALDRAEGIFEAARASGRVVTVEIVANSGGLDLLRADVSAHGDRIARLLAANPGLALVACGQTVQRLRDSGTEVRLLPGTLTATSALDEIVLRMQQGWAYVRI